MTNTPELIKTLIGDRDPGLVLEGYLDRWILGRSNVSVGLGATLLHRFHRGDSPVLHNHPWPFRSWILSGGYTEIRCDTSHLLDEDGKALRECDWPSHLLLERRVLRQGDINEIHGVNEFHFIESIEPDTWTLVSCGPRKRPGWGFLARKDGGLEFHKFKAGRRDIAFNHTFEDWESFIENDWRPTAYREY